MKADSSSSSSGGLDRLMTVFEVAIYLKVAQTTVRKWCSQGLIPFIRLGKRDLRIKMRDVAAFIAGSTSR
jgi:excisionase family DNA binding protein